MKAELDGHLAKEEMILFPLIRAMSGGDNGASTAAAFKIPIRVMLAEHDSAGEGLQQLRQLTDGYAPPEDACNTFRALYYELSEMEADLHRHIHLENNILFPAQVPSSSTSRNHSRPAIPPGRAVYRTVPFPRLVPITPNPFDS